MTAGQFWVIQDMSRGAATDSFAATPLERLRKCLPRPFGAVAERHPEGLMSQGFCTSCRRGTTHMTDRSRNRRSPYLIRDFVSHACYSLAEGRPSKNLAA